MFSIFVTKFWLFPALFVILVVSSILFCVLSDLSYFFPLYFFPLSFDTLRKLVRVYLSSCSHQKFRHLLRCTHIIASKKLDKKSRFDHFDVLILMYKDTQRLKWVKCGRSCVVGSVSGCIQAQ